LWTNVDQICKSIEASPTRTDAQVSYGARTEVNLLGLAPLGPLNVMGTGQVLVWVLFSWGPFIA
jgi:hypothetical protein